MIPSLAAIVPASDQPPTLERCLEAIRAAREPPDELIVVDEPAGSGPAAARNAGAERAKSELLAFVDSDVLVHPDALARLREAFAADPRLTAVFGSYDDAPEAPGVVSGFRNLLHHHVHQSAAGPAETFWAGLGCVRREAFLAVGGFDAERYRQASIEDVELGMRLADAGGRIELDPALQGTHLKAWSLVEAARTDFARRGAPWVRLLLERRQLPDHLNLGWRHRASASISVLGLAALAARRPVPAAGAVLGLVALNRSFYTLLLRRRGPLQAAAGVGLHALHHVIGAASIPTAALAEASGAVRGARPYAPMEEPALHGALATSSARPIEAMASAGRAAFLGARGRWRDLLFRRTMRRLAGPKLLRAFADSYPEAFFIEIGANDGEQADPLRPFVLSRPWRGIMVEPLPHVFDRLRRNYGSLDRVVLENAAIADSDGRLPLYHVGTLDGEDPERMPEWYDAIGSFSRETVLRHAVHIPDLERRVNRTEVPCLSFETLCRKHGVQKLDLMLIDTEGYDYEIIKAIDFAARHPRLLIYEHYLLSPDQRTECRAYVESLGYATMEEGFDTWCLDVEPDDPVTRRWRRLRPARPGFSMDELVEWSDGDATGDPAGARLVP